MSELDVFLWVTVNVIRRNSTKLAQGRICNTLSTSVLYHCIIFSFFFNFRKLVLSTNKVLYLLKQPLVGTLQKLLFYRGLFFTKAVALHLYKNRVPSQIFLQLFDHCCKLFLFLNHFQVCFWRGLIISRHQIHQQSFNLHLIFPGNINIRYIYIYIQIQLLEKSFRQKLLKF